MTIAQRGCQTDLFKRWGRALDKIVRAVDTLPAKRSPAQPAVQSAEAVHAREMLERIRHGEYEFSDAEICDILRRNNWLGAHQSWFESLDIPGDNLAEVRVHVPVLGRLVV